MNRYDEIVEFLNRLKGHNDLTGIVLLGSFSANRGDLLSDIDIDFIYYGERYIPVQLPHNNWQWDISEYILDGYPPFTREH